MNVEVLGRTGAYDGMWTIYIRVEGRMWMADYVRNPLKDYSVVQWEHISDDAHAKALISPEMLLLCNPIDVATIKEHAWIFVSPLSTFISRASGRTLVSMILRWNDTPTKGG